MQSMTGYGRATKENAEFRIEVETKSVNNRFLDIQARFPKECNPFESQLRKLVKQYASRGRVELYVNLTKLGEAGKTVSVQWGLIDQVVSQIRQGAKERYGETDFSIDELLARLAVDEHYVALSEQALDESTLEPLFLTAVEEALQALQSSRNVEGQGILSLFQTYGADIATRVSTLQSFVAVYEQDYRARFEAKLKEYLAKEVDEQRLLTEMAILLERGDIHEELDRLAIHLTKFNDLLQKSEPVGRELDFLIQEMNREVNTIGSKSSPIEIKNLVVELKTILEKIREQVQNVE